MAMKKKNQPELVPQVFEHEQFGSIRVVIIDGKPWFVAVDLCRILGYQNGSRDVNRHVDAEDRKIITRKQWEKMALNQESTVSVPYFSEEEIGGTQRLIFVNESGMYALIFGSQLPAAKKFKRWVTNEVLPSIRETGSYSVPKKKKELPTLPPDFFDKAKNDYEKVAMLEKFLEDNNVEYDYELKPKIIEDENGEPALCYSFSLVIKDE